MPDGGAFPLEHRLEPAVGEIRMDHGVQTRDLGRRHAGGNELTEEPANLAMTMLDRYGCERRCSVDGKNIAVLQ